MTRLRGTLRDCASRSRHAATLIKTANCLRERSRSLMRLQASLGREMYVSGDERIAISSSSHGSRPDCVEFDLQLLEDGTQMGNIRQGIGELLVREWPARPIGKAGRLVDLCLGELADDLLVADLVAEAANHGGNLRIEERRRNDAASVKENFDVLARRVKDLEYGRFVAISAKNGSRSMLGRQGIDDCLVLCDPAIWTRHSSGQ